MKKYNNGYIKKNNKEVLKMEKNEKMSIAINEFIMSDEFMMRFIVDNVKEKIYNERTYSESMIEDTLINDLDNNTDSYLISFIIDEIDIYDLVYKIDTKFRDDFIRLAQQTNQ